MGESCIPVGDKKWLHLHKRGPVAIGTSRRGTGMLASEEVRFFFSSVTQWPAVPSVGVIGFPFYLTYATFSSCSSLFSCWFIPERTGRPTRFYCICCICLCASE